MNTRSALATRNGGITPLIVGDFLYDSMEKGLKQVSQYCNAMKKLLARDDLRDVLDTRPQTSSAPPLGTALAGYDADGDYLASKALGNLASADRSVDRAGRPEGAESDGKAVSV